MAPSMPKFLPLCTLAALASATGSSPYCKPRPGDSAWPDADAWRTLNASINGNLLAPLPPGAVCHIGWPQYNNESCSMLSVQWTNTSFQAVSPVGVDYNDETCPPTSDSSCSTTGYPEYVVVARTAQDVQEGVKFANDSGIRLTIKGTGHDFPGRSSGGESLSIWTHNLRGLEVMHGDPRALKYGGSAAIKIAAGKQLGNVYKFAAKNNITFIGGADADVGIGGWTIGGGHGPLTAKYGLGGDQVIEMEVVTADGCLRTINAETEPDLFWAMRGGGAGTFAVLISVTMKAYPPNTASNMEFSYSTTSDSDTFWDLTTYFHTQLPHLAESGIYGYYFVTPRDMQEKNASIAGKITGEFVAPNLTAAVVREIVDPMETYIRNANWTDRVYPGSTIEDVGDFMTFWTKHGAEAAGLSARLGSRLLSNESLLGDQERLKDALKTSTPAPWSLLGHLVGPAPHTEHPIGSIPGGSNSVLPAWRKTYTHIVLPRSWQLLNQTQKTAATTDLRDVRVQALRDLEPNSGAYMSESDPTEPNWQGTKFGENYERLLRIKQEWDPSGVFWCKQCVGSELWETKGEFGIENGVGQNKVQLCRAEKVKHHWIA